MTDLILGEVTVSLAVTVKVKAAVLEKLEQRSCIDPVAFVVPVVNEVFRREGVFQRAGLGGAEWVSVFTAEAIIAYARMVAAVLELPEGADMVKQSKKPASKQTVFRSRGKQSFNARHGERMHVSIADQMKGYQR